MSQPSFVGQKVARVLCAGSAGLNVCPAGNKSGMHGYLALAMEIGPKLRERGYTRLMLHNPGGAFFKGWVPSAENYLAPPYKELQKLHGVGFTREMWVDQWELGESIGLRAVDRIDLQFGVQLLKHRYRFQEVICYIGSPESLRDPLTDGKRCVEPFIQAGVSIAFDHCYEWRSGDRISQLFDYVRGQGLRVYAEPRMSIGAQDGGHEKHLDGTVADRDAFDVPWKIKLADEAKYGEVLQLIDNAPGPDWPNGVTPVIHETTNVVPANWHLVGDKK